MSEEKVIDLNPVNKVKMLLNATLYEQDGTYFVEIERRGEDLRRQEVPPEHVPMLEMILSQL
jgi:negative regulator of genetic competence, sporulation and motility